MVVVKVDFVIDRGSRMRKTTWARLASYQKEKCAIQTPCKNDVGYEAEFSRQQERGMESAGDSLLPCIYR